MLHPRGLLSNCSLLLLLLLSSEEDDDDDDDDDDENDRSFFLGGAASLAGFVAATVGSTLAGAQRSQHSPAVKFAGIRWVPHLYLGHALV